MDCTLSEACSVRPKTAGALGINSIDFRLTEEQDAMQRWARDFAENEIAPYALEWDKNKEFPMETVKKMHQMGLMTIGVPAKYGGEDYDNVTQNLITEEIARGDAGIAITMVASTLLGANPVLVAATDKQKKWWYERELEGCITAFCFNESGAGSDGGDMFTRCHRVGDAYILNGTKQFISNGGIAGLYTVFAILDKKMGNRGMCAFMVDRNTPGISIGVREDKRGNCSSNSVSINFENVRVPVQNLLGKEGDGFKIAVQTHNISQLNIAAISLGVAEASFAAAAQYSFERYQFGKPIYESQPIQLMLSDMAEHIEAGRILCLMTAIERHLGLSYRESASRAKCFCSDTAIKVTSEVAELFGGDRYFRKCPIEKYLRDANNMPIFEVQPKLLSPAI